MKGTLTLEFREVNGNPRDTEIDVAFDIEEFDPIVFADALSQVAGMTSDNPESIESLLFFAMMLSRKRHAKDAGGDADEEEATDE